MGIRAVIELGFGSRSTNAQHVANPCWVMTTSSPWRRDAAVDKYGAELQVGRVANLWKTKSRCKSLTTREVLERETRVELATSTLARLWSRSPNSLDSRPISKLNRSLNSTQGAQPA